MGLNNVNIYLTLAQFEGVFGSPRINSFFKTTLQQSCIRFLVPFGGSPNSRFFNIFCIEDIQLLPNSETTMRLKKSTDNKMSTKLVPRKVFLN